MVNVRLYSYNGLPNVVNKSLGEPISTLTGYLYDSASVINPIIKIENFDLSANYLYIGELSRYYFIKSVRALNNGFFEVSCEVDTLYTYKDNILKATGDVIQSESGNKFLSSRSTDINLTPNLEKVEFPNKPFNEEGNIIMVTIKGN